MPGFDFALPDVDMRKLLTDYFFSMLRMTSQLNKESWARYEILVEKPVYNLGLPTGSYEIRMHYTPDIKPQEYGDVHVKAYDPIVENEER